MFIIILTFIINSKKQTKTNQTTNFIRNTQTVSPTNLFNQQFCKFIQKILILAEKNHIKGILTLNVNSGCSLTINIHVITKYFLFLTNKIKNCPFHFKRNAKEL